MVSIIPEIDNTQLLKTNLEFQFLLILNIWVLVISVLAYVKENTGTLSTIHSSLEKVFPNNVFVEPQFSLSTSLYI